MRKRRLLLIAAIVAVLAVVLVVILQTGPFAQDEGGVPGPPGGDAGGGAGPGGAPPPGGAGSPEELGTTAAPPAGGGPGGPPGGGPGGPPGGAPGAAPGGGGMGGGMPGGGGMGMGMGMGGPAGGGGGGMTWVVHPAPEELTMTYSEFLSKTGQARADIPAPFLTKPDGTPEKYTKNEWMQFQRLYGGAGRVVDEAIPGRIGKVLVKGAEDADAYHYHALKAMAKAYLNGLNKFTFEIGYPQVDYGTFGIIGGSGGNVTVRVPVVMRVKSGAAASYAEYVYNTLRKFDCLGMAIPQGNGVRNTSEPFYVHTRKGGMWHPQVINLPAQSGALWNLAWSSHAVGLALFDPNGQIIDLGLQPAGQTGGILAKMLNPDVIYFNPRYKLLIWPEGRTQSGARWNVSGTRGWAYEFTFTMPRDQARRIHRAQAKLVPTLALGLSMDPGALRDRWNKLADELAKINIDELMQRGSGGGAAGPGGPGGGGPGMPGGGGPGMGPGMGGGMGPGMGPGMGGGMGPGMGPGMGGGMGPGGPGMAGPPGPAMP